MLATQLGVGGKRRLEEASRWREAEAEPKLTLQLLFDFGQQVKRISIVTQLASPPSPPGEVFQRLLPHLEPTNLHPLAPT